MAHIIAMCSHQTSEVISSRNPCKLFVQSHAVKTLTRRVDVQLNGIFEQLSYKLLNLKYSSIAVEESIDSVDTAQLFVFVHAVNERFDINQVLAGMTPLNHRKCGEDIFRGGLEISTEGICIYNCIIHQESLWTRALKFDHTMKYVFKSVNFIRSRGLNHREFKSFLEDIEAYYRDIS
ncbi:hypothetical protein RF11_15823 [Thelohanellus kitauei]|uniref:General transcription factor II-I repeat domain-containing protein 2 n=1 Tax=Thelohanellus kitauei TaxID=669202 RepID=A0A0C2JAZ8_THEKT|nr:hypothetical protein RF11_15823 [Thelohanellus kitauei]